MSIEVPLGKQNMETKKKKYNPARLTHKPKNDILILFIFFLRK